MSEMPAIPDICHEDGHRLAGVIDAESHLGITKSNGGRSFHCFMNVGLRTDDLGLLEWMQVKSGNTLAARFGSWYDVLAAAGVAERAAVGPARRDAGVAAGAAARAERREAARARTVDAVRRCAAALGHVPGATEYARWRFHNEPAAPSFGTAYRLFPGGWRELQAAAQA
jgi:hypothetical protein